jgi:glutaconate CoA-transferase subunit A
MPNIRRSKVVSLKEAVAEFVKAGSSLGIGGIMHDNRPCAFIREVTRQGIGDLTLYSGPVSGYDVDLLIGAGLVKETRLPMVSLGDLGLAPNFRKAVEGGEIKAHLLDIVTDCAGLLAGIQRQPYHFVQSLKGTSMLAVSPLYETLTDSHGDKFTAVKAFTPDVTVLHAEQADEYGNIRNLTPAILDRMIAKAAKKVVVTVEEIIPHSEILREPTKTTLGTHWVHAVIEVPYGAHPCSTAYYRADEKHLREYRNAAEANRLANPAAFNEYMRKYIYAPVDNVDYLTRVGGLRRLLELKMATGKG